jgi:cytochrome P450
VVVSHSSPLFYSTRTLSRRSQYPADHPSEYESHVTTLSITPTKLLPGAAIQAREFLVAGFERYLAQGQHHNQYRDDNNEASNVSPFLYTRYKHHTTGRLTPTDIARWELLTCLALLFNTAPAAFWLIYHLISDPVLLAQCRAELEKGAVTIRGNHNTDDNDNDNSDANNEEGAHGEVKTVSLDWIRRECPLLMVTLHEVFRFRGIGMPVVRRVLEDHRLGGRWVLRKGGIVLIPTSVIHFEEAVWGKDAGEFKPARFLKSDGEGGCVDGVRMRKRTRTLRVFGGGATRCPGREFVQSQILAFAALMVLQFELKPIKAGDGRQWVEPQTDGSFKMGLSRAFPVPERDFDVEICARQPEREWRVVVTDARGSA